MISLFTFVLETNFNFYQRFMEKKYKFRAVHTWLVIYAEVGVVYFEWIELPCFWLFCRLGYNTGMKHGQMNTVLLPANQQQNRNKSRIQTTADFPWVLLCYLQMVNTASFSFPFCCGLWSGSGLCCHNNLSRLSFFMLRKGWVRQALEIHRAEVTRMCVRTEQNIYSSALEIKTRYIFGMMIIHCLPS